MPFIKELDEVSKYLMTSIVNSRTIAKKVHSLSFSRYNKELHIID
jgi:hypothetical protein